MVALVGFAVVLSTLSAVHRWAFVVAAGLVVCAAATSRLRVTELATRAIPALPFLAATALIPVVSSSDAAVGAAAALALKIVIGASASALFASVTQPADLAIALGRIGVPKVIVSVISFMFRYLDLMVAEVGRIRVALVSRGYSPSWLAQARPIASSSGAMLVRSFERGERVHSAMLSRGFTGEMPSDDSVKRGGPLSRLLAAMPAVGLLGARTLV